jgi:glycosyltransferase involved in cell wall biosynthesis
MENLIRKSDPITSVIIPTFNRENIIPRAINSVLSQTYKNFEILIVDDGSSDNTEFVIKSLREPRIQYIKQKNSGQAAARNTGINHSIGKYIAFLDDDDYWFPNKLEQQIDQLESHHEIGLSASGWLAINEESKLTREYKPWIWIPDLNDLNLWLYSCPIIPSAVVARKEYLVMVGGFDEGITQKGWGAEDWDLWLRLVHLGCKMQWLDDISFTYYFHDQSYSHQAIRQRNGMMLVIHQFYKNNDLSEEIRNSQKKVMAVAHLRSAAREYGGGLLKEAKQDIEQAIDLFPDLKKENGRLIYDSLMGWLGNVMIRDPQIYVTRVFDNFSPIIPKWSRRRRAAIALAAKITYFDAYIQKDRDVFFKSFLKITFNQPQLLVDRGIFSIMVEVLFGVKVHKFLKECYCLIKNMRLLQL